MQSLPTVLSQVTDDGIRQAISLWQQGQWTEARTLCHQSQLQPPDDTAARYLEAVIDFQTGQAHQAMQRIQQAIQANPQAGELYALYGEMCFQLGMLEPAYLALEEACRLGPCEAETYWYAGLSGLQLNRLDSAIGLLQMGSRQYPDNPDVLMLLGQALKKAGQFREAIPPLQAALALRPQDPELYFLLGDVYQGLDGQIAQSQDLDIQPLDYLEQAIWHYTQGLSLKPDDADVYYNLGNAYFKLEKLEPAEASYQECVRLNPRHYLAHNNLGILYRVNLALERAEDHYNKCLDLSPAFPDAAYNLSVVRLLNGDFENAWTPYETRNQKNDYIRHFAKPLWDGRPFPGKRLLVWAEGGYGDTFQFIRYLPQVKAMGGEVILVTQEGTAELFKDLPGVDQLIERPYQGFEGFISELNRQPFDLLIGLMSLPALFRTTEATIPRPGVYLKASTERLAHWQNHLNQRIPPDRLRIGIAWSGTRTVPAVLRRSCPLLSFEPLLEMEGVQCISLQKSLVQDKYNASLASSFEARGMLIPLGETLRDFSDTAAVLASIDLLVSIDTGLVHLAGAMGRPAWLMLPYSPDWRWMLHRTDTPWYDSVRLFRQAELGDWDGLMEALCQQLQQQREQMLGNRLNPL